MILKREIMQLNKQSDDIDNIMAIEEEEFKDKRVNIMHRQFQLTRETQELNGKIDKVKRDTKISKDNYLREIGLLAREIEKLKKDNDAIENTNHIQQENIREEKKRQYVEENSAPKISQVFLASSQLATLIRKQKEQHKDDYMTGSHHALTHEEIREVDEPNLEKELEFVRKKNQEFRKARFEEMEKKVKVVRVKKGSKSVPRK